MDDIIVIGAGPAGLTAALYGARAGKKVTLITDKDSQSQIINSNNIENYPGIENMNGYDYISTLTEQVMDLDVNYVVTKIKEVNLNENKVIDEYGTYFIGKSIIIATGCNTKKLNVVGENDFLGKGVSYCATCDGNFFKNKKVAVIGGGNTALDDALYLSNIVEKVYLIHRRNEFRGSSLTVEKLKTKSNVEFVLNSRVKKINGDSFVNSIDVEKDGVINNLEVNGVFIAVGQTPNSSLFDVEKDEFGYIKCDEDLRTNIDGIYVAGDVRVKSLRQLTTAVGDGANAAMQAINDMN